MQRSVFMFYCLAFRQYFIVSTLMPDVRLSHSSTWKLRNILIKLLCPPTCNTAVNVTVIKQIHEFRYLRYLISFDGRRIDFIKRRMAQANQVPGYKTHVYT